MATMNPNRLLVRASLILLIIFVGLVAGCVDERIETAIATETPTHTVRLPATATITPNPSPTSTPTLSTSTSTSMPVPATAALPTQTATLPKPTEPPPAYPTPTPTAMPVRELSLPFEDRFDTELRSEWEKPSGDWRIANGSLTTITRGRWSYVLVGDPTWQDYTIEVDFGGELVQIVAVIVRAQNTENCVQFQLEQHRSSWIIRHQGQESELVKGDGTYWHKPSNRAGHLKVEVRGSSYRVYYDEKLWLSISDTTFSSGRVGLGTYCDNTYYNCKTFDNFRVVELSE